ncbi:craniofacial development protein 2-like [Sitophilus oryzae]|uniref:Craniofacial development protein 2-like n=1 Tax=Sitophilus oryzae TaxID=7048 RepID=A0A6J2YJA4_SITOR|nr:craniofacial development protein 2-like [Sitophilus oryzae]
MNFATWNVQGIRLKKDIIAAEMQKQNMNLIAFTETKKKGQGTENVGEYIHLYTGVTKEKRAARGVSVLIKKSWKNKIRNWEAVNENILTINIILYGYNIIIIAAYAPSEDERDSVKQDFFDKLDQLLEDFSRYRDVILLGDFNGRTGRKNNSQIVGPFGEATTNDNGERLIDLCETHDLKINNGFFKHKDIHRYTWTQNTRNLKSIIDYVISKQETHIEINDVRVLRGITCGSDHFLVRAKIRIHFRKMDKLQENHNTGIPMELMNTVQYNFNSFNDDSTVFLYQRRLDSKLLDPEECTFNEIYENIKSSPIAATKEAIGTKEYSTNKKFWWNDEMESYVEEKKQKYLKWLSTKTERDLEEYKISKRQLRTHINRAKNKAWDIKCEQINNYIGGRKCSEIWKCISNIKNPGITNLIYT